MDYKVYSSNFDLTTRGLEILEASLKKDPEELAKIPVANFRAATHQSAQSRLELLTRAYSAGHELSELRSYYPTVLADWERYAHYSVLHNETETGQSSHSAHIPLKDLPFSYANRLVAFGILLGWKNLLYKIPKIIDYNNPDRDGMLERILSRYLADRTDLPDECTRHLPYYNTIRIFTAPASERSALVAEYLEDWYEASRREPYFDSHKRGSVFQGYWSWEAAAITIALDIDDTPYRHAQFYPADLVDFARQSTEAYEPRGFPGPVEGELRAKAGDPCPKGGDWQSLDTPPRTITLSEQQAMPHTGSVYGLTVWRFIG
ncbi:DUF1911 domain-containing protein [Pseudoduganella sp. SL102]|uniref:PoNe immunity protein domain-containing protein n=1 Tax=Pseudoduganella sp. SL102 TaxID=2995154 RepID=UPI00248B0A02|nr:PoNe immunity protein domain-containing protein [Pseudoduganella sp. SL102]WBS04809.1 DUF1911 domain-containing protein [Pseudoduganella sp. SL102]